MSAPDAALARPRSAAASRRTRWREPLLQVATIVLGILVAFAVDRGWELRGARAREAAYIERLRTEFADSRAEIQRDIAARAAALTQLARLLQAAGGAPALGGYEVARIAAGALVEYRFYTAKHAAYDEIVATGALGLLRSRVLREALLEYDQERERLGITEGVDREVLLGQVLPWVAEHAVLVHAMPVENRKRLELPAAGPRLDGAELPLDARLANLAYLRWRYAEVAQRYSEEVLAAIDRVQTALGPAR